jgi:hypothetical protein
VLAAESVVSGLLGRASCSPLRRSRNCIFWRIKVQRFFVSLRERLEFDVIQGLTDKALWAAKSKAASVQLVARAERENEKLETTAMTADCDALHAFTDGSLSMQTLYI